MPRRVLLESRKKSLVSFLQSAVTHKRQNYADRCRAAGKLFAVCAFEVSGGIYLSEMKSVLKRIHRGISGRSAISYAAASFCSIFRSRSNGPMLIPYHSNRLLPLVEADSASFLYDTKINKTFLDWSWRRFSMLPNLTCCL